jgi:uncharacterized protein (TIRG00374 family)
MRVDEPDVLPVRGDAPQGGLVPWLKRWGPRILGVLLFAFVLRTVGVGRVWMALREADPWLLLPAFLATIPFLAVKARRWAGLAMGLGTPPIGPVEALRLYAIGIWWGQATPGQAGDFVKAWYLRRQGAALAPALTSCVLDRLFDFVALFALSGLALFAYAGGGQSVILVVALFALVCFMIAAVVTERWRTPLLAFLARLTPRPIRERLAGIELLRSLTELQLDARQLLPALAWTAASWIVSVGRVWLCFIALGVNLPLADFMIVVMLQTLAGLISIGGVGTRDAALVALLARYGYDGGQAVAISFLILGLNFANILPGFLLWLRDPVPRAEPDVPEGAGRPGAVARVASE